MKNIFKLIKQTVTDNKEYFIKGILMIAIAGLIFSLVICFVVPVSAEASTQTIYSGIYKWHNTVTLPSDFDIPINGYIPEIIIDGVSFEPSFSSIVAFFDDSLNGGNTVVGYSGSFGGTPSTFFAYSDSDLWTLAEEIGLPAGYGQTFVVSADVEVSDYFYTWFSANVEFMGIPDDDYVIESGYYKVRDSWNTSGFPVTNDSIEFRYYDELDHSYIEAEGIAFLIENRDMISIWYMDNNVYLDGWNIEGAKFIEVTQDITVEPEFYTVFNNVYASSSEGSNEFDSGYAAGYVDGRSDGYDIGYRQGYAQGLNDGDQNIFTNIIGGTLGALDSFTIFGGFSLLDLISTLLGGMALVWILKLLAGG